MTFWIFVGLRSYQLNWQNRFSNQSDLKTLVLLLATSFLAASSTISAAALALASTMRMSSSCELPRIPIFRRSWVSLRPALFYAYFLVAGWDRLWVWAGPSRFVGGFFWISISTFWIALSKSSSKFPISYLLVSMRASYSLNSWRRKRVGAW